jgi:uncharacterized protein (TIGR04222 family)
VNPFDLRGPQFLLFYAVLVAAVLVVLRRRGGGGGRTEAIADPLELAFLRGGPAELLRVALLSLLDRRLLKAAEGKVSATAPADLVRRPIERALLGTFAEPKPTHEVFGDARVEQEVEQVRSALERRGLVPSDEERGRRTRALAVAVLVLVGVAGAKVVVALSRGRHNVLFLVLLAGAGILLATFVGRPGTATPLGAGALSRAKAHFQRLRTRAGELVPGGETNELALLLALYGFGALPPLARDLMREAHLARAAVSGSSSCGSSCGGSSCGSSSCGGGSSCSSGCGGCGGGGCS